METPAIQVPMMTMSTYHGSCSVERYSSSQCGSLRQYDAVELGTGSILFCLIISVNSAKRLNVTIGREGILLLLNWAGYGRQFLEPRRIFDSRCILSIATFGCD